MLIVDAVMTPEYMAKEYVRCASDYWHYLTTYVKTLDVERNLLLPFASFENPKYTEYIHSLLDEIHRAHMARRAPEFKHPDFIIVKSRQLYLTTAISGYLLWCLLFRDNFNGIITTIKDQMLDGQPLNDWNKSIGRIQAMLETTPEWLRPNPVDLIRSDGVIAFTTRGSKIYGDAGLQPASGTQVDIHLGDEWAKQDFTLTKQASLAKAVKCVNIKLSTPNGRNEFYESFKQAQDEPTKTSYQLWKPYWRDRIPVEKQQAYWEQTVRECDGNEALARQELEHSFAGLISTGRTFDKFIQDKHTLLIPKNFTTGHSFLVFDFGNSPAVTAATLFTIRSVTGFPTRMIILDCVYASGMHPREFSVLVRDMLGRYRLLPDIYCLGDPSGVSKPREGTGQSSFDLFGDEGFFMNPASNRVMEGIMQVNGAFWKNQLFVNKELQSVIDALNGCTTPKDNDKYTTTPPHPGTDIIDTVRYGVVYGLSVLDSWMLPGVETGFGTNQEQIPGD